MAVISEKCPEIKVTLVDLNEKRIAEWNSDDYQLPVYEPNLKPLIKKNRNKNLFFTTKIKEAINEAMRDWVTHVRSTHYILGSALGAHPYPGMVRDFHRVIGEETKRQFLEKTTFNNFA